MLQPTPLADLPPFSDTAAASIRRQLAARRLCDLCVHATGRLQAGRLRPVAAPFLPLEFLPGCTRPDVDHRAPPCVHIGVSSLALAVVVGACVDRPTRSNVVLLGHQGRTDEA